MFAKTLIKLIDYSIFPAFLIIAAKVVSVALLAAYIGADYSVAGLSLNFSNKEDFISINSYSSVIMYFSVIAGLVWVTVKAHLFHETHITPSFSAKLFSMNMDELITTTETVFSQAFIWLSYAWISTILFGIHSYYQLAYGWVFWGALGATILATGALAIDLEREISASHSSKSEDRNGSGRKVIKFEELAEEILA